MTDCCNNVNTGSGYSVLFWISDTNNNDDQSMELTVKSKQLIKTAKTADFCTRPRPRPRLEGSRPRPRPRPGGSRPRPRPDWTGLEWSRDQDRGLEDYNTGTLYGSRLKDHISNEIRSQVCNSNLHYSKWPPIIIRTNGLKAISQQPIIIYYENHTYIYI